MKVGKALLVVLVVSGALVVFGRFFLSELGGARHDGEPSAVPFGAPAGFAIEEAGDLSRAEAARRLDETLARSGADDRVGIHFTSDGAELYWFVDRADPEGPRLVERSANPAGTRLETVWPGDVARRLAWAGEHGDLEAPGMPAGASHNLYH